MRAAKVAIAGLAAVAGFGVVECVVDHGEDKRQAAVLERRSDVEIFEDGSGVQYVGTTEVRTFPEGTFVWHKR